MIPRRVIPHVGFNHLRRPFQLLGLVKQIEPLHKPLPIAPHMIVLGILLKHCVYEFCFALGRAKRIDDGVSVMPYLVVLEVLEGGRVEPRDFVLQRDSEFRYRLCAVQPGTVSLCVVGSMCRAKSCTAPPRSPQPPPAAKRAT